jgi:hypothetical protein
LFYLGEDQIELSKVRNPHHTAMIPQAAGGAYRFADLLEGGALGLSQAAPWFLKWGSKVDPAPEAPKVDLSKMFLTLPLIQMLKQAGAPHTDFEDFARTRLATLVGPFRLRGQAPPLQHAQQVCPATPEVMKPPACQAHARERREPAVA